MSGTGIDVLPNLPNCPVPILMSYRTYRSVRYRYWCHAELTGVSGAGIDVVPNLPNCLVPVIPAVYSGGIPRYAPCRTHPSLYAVQKVPFGLSTEKKWKMITESLLELESKTSNLHCLGWFLCESDSKLHILVRSQKKKSFVQVETGFLCEIGRRDGNRAICCWFALVTLQQFS